MRAGKLRHRIVIQEKSVTRTASGAETVSWAEYDTLWASVEPLSGRELEMAKQLHDEISVRMWIRYRSGVAPEMRVSWDSRTFDVVSVLNTAERDIKMQLMCREVT
jgi:SPP1 family predicted phage head-tail adaptor